MKVLLAVLLGLSTSSWGTRETLESDESSMLAKPPIKVPTPAPAPDVAAALAALAAAKDAAPPAPAAPAPDLAAALLAAKAKASAAPAVPSAPDLAADLAALRASLPPKEAAPKQAPPAADLAADLAALRAALPPKENAVSEAATGELHTIRIRKQYVPVPDKNGNVIAYKTAYFGNIHVGGPENPQDFTVVFDTGSAHLVLPSSNCDSDTCLKHKRYNSSVSDASQNVEHDGTLLLAGEVSTNQVTITFGTGTVKGTFVQDDACLGQSGDIKASGCSRVNMVVAEQMSEHPFSLFQFDGILGLGLEALGLAPSFSFFGQMVAQRPAMQPRFAVFLARTDQGVSSISFGGHDTNKAATGLQWTDVAMPELGYWQVNIRQVRVGDTVIDDCADGGCRAILDTGTSLLGAPRQALKSLHSLLSRDVLQAPGGYGDGEGHVSESAATEASATDCRMHEGLPLIFDLGEGLEVSLDPEDYFRPKPFNMTMPDIPGAWKLTCRSLLLPLDLPAPLGPRAFILGEPVLRKYYTIYDWASRRVGFAMADHSTDGLSDGAVGTPDSGSLVAGAPLPLLAKGSSNGDQNDGKASKPAEITM